MSTVILPDAPLEEAGHSTGMELQDILSRIERRLKAVKLTPDAASRAAGKPDAIRNIKRAVRDGARTGVSTDTIRALAPVLKTSASWLLEGDEPDVRSEDVAAGLDHAPAPTVKVKGYVGAGSVAHFYALSDEDFEEVPAPADATDQTVAVEIKGSSWGPRMNTWLVFYDDVRSPITADLIGQTCVVGLSDDRILIKEIQRNGRGGYRLLSNAGAEDDIEDAQIEWAAKVTSMRPR